jgi:hypothetical protein
VFLICAAIYIVGGVLNFILCGAELEPWARIEQQEEKIIEKSAS